MTKYENCDKDMTHGNFLSSQACTDNLGGHVMFVFAETLDWAIIFGCWDVAAKRTCSPSVASEPNTRGLRREGGSVVILAASKKYFVSWSNLIKSSYRCGLSQNSMLQN